MASFPPPNLPSLLLPLLQSLPAATAAPQPPTALLPSLSPILRQRVQVLSSGTQDPWIELLCYDASKASRLTQAVQSDKFEPHPVSGEVEIDWDGDVRAQYRRVDEETLQALVSLEDLGLNVKLIWCVGDAEGGGDGWRIGEVGVVDAAEDSHWGSGSIKEAEDQFESKAHASSSIVSPREPTITNRTSMSGGSWDVVEPMAEDDDDDYWAQYDNTPARTPGPQRSPAPAAMQRSSGPPMSEEDAYFAQYADVQPAMDSHDPDEAAENGEVESTLGRADIAQQLRRNLPSHPEFPDSQAGGEDQNPFQPPPYTDSMEDLIRGRGMHLDEESELVQPRPASSNSSQGSATVARLERNAAAHGQSEMGVKQHLATSVKSLYRLAKASGIDRSEFSRLVRTELDLLSLSDGE